MAVMASTTVVMFALLLGPATAKVTAGVLKTSNCMAQLAAFDYGSDSDAPVNLVFEISVPKGNDNLWIVNVYDDNFLTFLLGSRVQFAEDLPCYDMVKFTAENVNFPTEYKVGCFILFQSRIEYMHSFSQFYSISSCSLVLLLLLVLFTHSPRCDGGTIDLSHERFLRFRMGWRCQFCLTSLPLYRHCG